MFSSTDPFVVAGKSSSLDHGNSSWRQPIGRTKPSAWITMPHPSLKGTRGLWLALPAALMFVICTSVVYAARGVPLKGSSKGEDTNTTILAALPGPLPNSTVVSKPPRTQEEDTTAPTGTMNPRGRLHITSSNMVEVWTVDGNITGRKIRVMNEDVAVFLGVPYAAPTQGTGRFRNPNETQPWCTPLDATDPGPSCPQPMATDSPNPYTLVNISEDCLRLNIWAPLCKTGEDPKTCLYGRPVMVYFFGGGFQRGANSLPFYDGRYLAALGRVVVAVPNYRVGVFGFPSRPIPGADQNTGLQDLILAMTWLKTNADSFGGNSNDIVPFGQSAGGTAIGTLLAAGYLRPSQGTRKVIISSGAVLGPPWNPPADQQWSEFLRSLWCSTDIGAALSCLASKSPEQIVQAQERFPGVVGMTFPDPGLLADTPSIAMSAGVDLRGVQLLLTNTIYEGDLIYSRAFSQRNVNIADIVNSVHVLSKLSGRNKSELIRDLQQLYPMQGSSNYSVGVDLLGDIFFNCPAVTLSDLACESHSDVRHVILAEKPERWGTWHRSMTGASHSDDLPYVFGVPLAQGPPNDMEYAKKVIHIWTGFAWSGVASLPSHPSRCHDNNRPSVILYRDHDKVIQKWRRDQCCFLDRYIGYETHDVGRTTMTP